MTEIQNIVNPPPPPRGSNEQQSLMESPAVVPGCPPGLEYLIQLDKLRMEQDEEDPEKAVKYVIKNSVLQQCYTAYEDSSSCAIKMCGPARGFKIFILDNNNQNIIKVERKFKCCAGCCWCACLNCCSFVIDVETADGTLLGSVRQAYSFWKPTFDIIDADDNTVIKIVGPYFVDSGVCCSWNMPYIISSFPDEEVIGDIIKEGLGFSCIQPQPVNFVLNFPLDLDVKVKSLLMAAVFLIDMMFFKGKRMQLTDVTKLYCECLCELEDM